jgi:polyhydroxyalkanoate synthesis repressor PhaR
MVRAARIVIKKYGNRRLYDTSTSRYVNLEDIAGFIRNGKEVQVVDAKTGADLTRVTLTQIIVEDAKEQPAGLPLELLRQLIVASDNVRQEFTKSALDTYQKMQSALQSGLTGVRSAALSPLDLMTRFVQGTAGKPSGESDELQELRKRVAQLEARVEKPKRPPKRRKSRA